MTEYKGTRRCSSAGRNVAALKSNEHKQLVKQLSAVTFKDNDEIVGIDKDLPSSRSIVWTHGNKQFKTILKKSMPKLKSIQMFNTLHENMTSENLEKNDALADNFDYSKPNELENCYDLTRSRVMSGKKKKSLRKSKSLLSVKSNSSSNSNLSRNELVTSFVRNSLSADNIQKGSNKENKIKKNEPKSAKARLSGKSKSKRNLLDPVIINTRPKSAELCSNIALRNNDNDLSRECVNIHNKLLNKGIQISLNTIRRALLPPHETRVEVYEINHVKLPDSCNNGLLSHPSVWLPREYNRLKAARKRMEDFDEEYIRRSMVVTSDDEEEENNGSILDSSTVSNLAKISLYRSFARKSQAGLGHSSRASAPSSGRNRKHKNSTILTKASSVYKISDSQRPSTAGI